MKKLFVVLVVLLMLVGCGAKSEEAKTGEEEKTVYKVGICNFVDDASLNQIIANIKEELANVAKEKGVEFEIDEQNCNTDAAVLAQIIADFEAEEVDLMVGVATPVAMAMQGATEENQIPVVFAAVSDPIGAGLVNSLENPGANITGTSDYLDTTAVMNLILAQNEGIDTVGLFYDLGQDSSYTAIQTAKAFLDSKNISYKEYNGTNTTEVSLAVDSMIADGIKACFTPSDNTIMAAELSIYEKMAEAGIQHYAGADSFALNGAFVGYGVDYANLGKVTGSMVADILLNDKDVATYPVATFDNGTATVNTEICAALGFEFETVKATFAPLCSRVAEIVTAESFD